MKASLLISEEKRIDLKRLSSSIVIAIIDSDAYCWISPELAINALPVAYRRAGLILFFFSAYNVLIECCMEF